ncbi:hypothetical protein PG996_013872 [Apiospora saccharicola]|uniref:Uncharacterized protein n=1 Tax=Apiospora saccharicola TaxID=335842 RepID=A0ABR1TGP2_9PEZI
MVANGAPVEAEAPCPTSSAAAIEPSDALSGMLRRWCCAAGPVCEGPATSDSEVEDTLEATEAARPGGGADCSRSAEEPLRPESITTDGTVTTSLPAAPLSTTRPPTRVGLGV